MVSQLGDAIDYCHEQNIIHLDIKPENIMLSNDLSIVKLIDFGTSCNDKKTCNIGTSDYYASPILDSKIKQGIATLKDIKDISKILDQNV